MPFRLLIALAISLILHGGLLAPNLFRRLAVPTPPALQATLRLPPKPLPPPEPLQEPLLKNTLDEAETPPQPETKPPPAPSKPPAPAPTQRKREVSVAQRKLSEHLFYPPEAVARGLQGEVRLILKLGEKGTIEEVLIAAGSGHAILDNAAIRAAYAMGRLPGVSSRELIFPVVFRLQ